MILVEGDFMIKRLIFDLDDTLIDWKEEYWNAILKALEDLKLPSSLFPNLKQSIEDYETHNLYYNKQEILEAINHNLETPLPFHFITQWLFHLEKCVPSSLEKEKLETLQNLQGKYELVLLTDWFKNCQIARLKNVGIYSFFKEIYASEDFPRKPSKESYLRALGPYPPSECVMIGDSLQFDILIPVEMGINAIYYNPKHQPYEGDFPSISHFQEIFSVLELLDI